MPSGIITEISPAKGYGFIEDGESRAYIRFDLQSVIEEVGLRDYVSYTVVELYPGRMAVNLKKIPAQSGSELNHYTDGRQHSSRGVGNGT